MKLSVMKGFVETDQVVYKNKIDLQRRARFFFALNRNALVFSRIQSLCCIFVVESSVCFLYI